MDLITDPGGGHDRGCPHVSIQLALTGSRLGIFIDETASVSASHSITERPEGPFGSASITIYNYKVLIPDRSLDWLCLRRANVNFLTHVCLAHARFHLRDRSFSSRRRCPF